MKFIVSGFLPFRDQIINPSQIIVNGLTARQELETVVLPVVYEQSWKNLRSLLEKNREVFKKEDFRIVLLGQAAGRKQICLEKYAHNLADSSYSDADGTVFLDRPILEKNDLALDSNFSLRILGSQAREKDLPIEISYSAGAFVCNYVYYHTLNWLKENQLPANAVFIHLPLTTDLELEKQKQSIDWILDQLKSNLIAPLS